MKHYFTGAIRVFLRTIYAPIYLIWLRWQIAVWGTDALEYAVYNVPSYLALAILKANGVHIGHGIDFHGRLQLHGAYEMSGKLHIGEWVHISECVALDLVAPIKLCDKCVISMNVRILTHLDMGYSPLARTIYATRKAGVTIQAGAFIGAGATILPGVTVGECSVVGAGALVNRDVPPYTVVAGVPAEEVRKLPKPLPVTTET